MAIIDKTFDDIESESLQTEFAEYIMAISESVDISDVNTLVNATALWQANTICVGKKMQLEHDSALEELNDACGAVFYSISEVCHFIKQIRIELQGKEFVEGGGE